MIAFRQSVLLKKMIMSVFVFPYRSLCVRFYTLFSRSRQLFLCAFAKVIRQFYESALADHKTHFYLLRNHMKKCIKRTEKGAIYGTNKSKMAATAMLEKFHVAISPQPVVRSTSCLVIGWGFRGRRI